MSGRIPVDFTIQKIFNKIKGDLKEQGIEVTSDCVHEIVSSQFRAVKYGMFNCLSIYCKYFGTFSIKKFILENNKFLNETTITDKAKSKRVKKRASGKEPLVLIKFGK